MHERDDPLINTNDFVDNNYLNRQLVIVPTVLHQTQITRLKGLRAFSRDEDYTEIMVESPPVSVWNRKAWLLFTHIPLLPSFNVEQI